MWNGAFANSVETSRLPSMPSTLSSLTDPSLHDLSRNSIMEYTKAFLLSVAIIEGVRDVSESTVLANFQLPLIC